MSKHDKARGLALEALAIILSILAAFAIDAWWEGQGERREERRVLATLLDEMQANQIRLAEKRAWQAGIENATNALLAASAAARRSISSDSLDHLLGDASWWNGYTTFEMSAVNAVIFGGGLVNLSDHELRQALTDWQLRIEVVELNERQDYDAFFGVWMPFLREHANLPQIANSIHHVPGSNEPNFGDSVPVPAFTDHTPLLQDQRFNNVVLQRKWVHDDVLHQYELLEPVLERLLGLLSQALSASAP